MVNRVSPLIVFTDLDGTLLNHNDYSYEAALPTIARLKNLSIPLIFVTSKTLSEVRVLRSELGVDWPYVCENGSLVVIPNKYRYLAQEISTQGTQEQGEYLFLFGASRENLDATLDALRDEYKFRTFSDMSNAEIAERTGLTEDLAALANDRRSSEPVAWEDSLEHLDGFIGKLLKSNCRVVKGGRFYHIMGNTDKAAAVIAIKNAYENFHEIVAHSIVLGDSDNDRDMLRTATTAVIIPKMDGTTMKLDDIASVMYAPEHGAAGWSNCVEELLKKFA